MDNKKQNNILNNARKNGDKVTIYLVSGNKLQGTVEGFDDFVVILNKNGKQNMIYKQAISTVICE
ncbi:MAG: RNA chaperone Hfq [Bacillota bacterium]